MDFDLIHYFLAVHTGWAKNIPAHVLRRSMENSLCFGGFIEGFQIGFARVVSDYATYAHLMDVFVLPAYRGKGHGKALVAAVLRHPRLQGLRRFTLATRDAHGLYARHGFSGLRTPESCMERYSPGLYEMA